MVAPQPFAKISSYPETRRERDLYSWQLIYPKSVVFNDAPDIEAVQLLEKFIGLWVMADAVICQIRSIDTPPLWSCIYWPDSGGSWMYFSLGKYVSIYLPISKVDSP